MDSSKKRTEEQSEDGARASSPPVGSLRRWLAANRTDLRFLFIFGACMGVYYLATLTSPVRDGFFPSYLRLNARASGAMLHLVGQDVSVDGQALISARGPAIQVERGCDAVAPSALFVAAVMASPVTLTARLSAAAVGTLLLMLLNLIRVVSLFLVRVYWPRAFDTMHLDVWQALFIFMALVLWAMWAARASQKHIVSKNRHATP